MGNITKGASRHVPPFAWPLLSCRQGSNSPWEPLYKAIMEDDSSTIKALLADYSVNEPLSVWKEPYIMDLLSFQDHANSPIHLAAKYRKERSLQCLLESGADPKIRNNRGYTALHLLLLNLPRSYTAGAPISDKRQRNQPTLQHNTEKSLCTLHNVKHHINPEMSNHKSDSLLRLGQRSEGFQAISILIEHGANIDDTDKFGRTALHIAAVALDEQVTATLIAYGANINFPSPKCGRTALHFAVCTASFKASRILGTNVDCIRLLLNNGAKVNIQDHEGRTAIHEACSGGRKEIVDLLLEYKADLNSLTRDGQSPLFTFLQHRTNLKYTALLNKLLGLSYPLRLRDDQGHLPPGLLFSEFQMLKDHLITLSNKLPSLQDICIFTVRRIYGEKHKYWLKKRLPVIVWNSLYSYEDFSTLWKNKTMMITWMTGDHDDRTAN